MPLPEVIVPLYSGLAFGSGISPNLLLPVPLPEETILSPVDDFLAAWISLNWSPVHFEASLSTQINPLPLPARILILAINQVKLPRIYLGCLAQNYDNYGGICEKLKNIFFNY